MLRSTGTATAMMPPRRRRYQKGQLEAKQWQLAGLQFGGRSKLLKMEALGRVELPTNGLGNRCSIHLSYRAKPMRFH